MDYSRIIDELNNASLFELFRLSSAIDDQLTDPKRIRQVKDRKGNELYGEVNKLNRKTAGVRVGSTNWRVTYSLLRPVIDGEVGKEGFLLEGVIVNDSQA